MALLSFTSKHPSIDPNLNKVVSKTYIQSHAVVRIGRVVVPFTLPSRTFTKESQSQTWFCTTSLPLMELMRQIRSEFPPLEYFPILVLSILGLRRCWNNPPCLGNCGMQACGYCKAFWHASCGWFAIIDAYDDRSSCFRNKTCIPVLICPAPYWDALQSILNFPTFPNLPKYHMVGPSLPHVTEPLSSYLQEWLVVQRKPVV